MYNNSKKCRVPQPHPLFSYQNSLSKSMKNNSHIGKSSVSVLHKIQNQSIPSRDFSYSSTPNLEKRVLKKTIIRSNPSIANEIKKFAKAFKITTPQTETSFFFANIILPKKKLPALYSKGFYIGSRKYASEESKHSSSKSLAFIKIPKKL